MQDCDTTCSFWRPSTRTPTTCRRASASRGPRPSLRDTIVRGSAGLFYDRVPLRAVANAILSAGNTTDLTRLRQISVTLAPATDRCARRFPNILSAAVPSVTLVNFTTMDRNIQNAYSRQASVEVERKLGEHGTYSVGYQYVRGLHLILR